MLRDLRKGAREEFSKGRWYWNAALLSADESGINENYVWAMTLACERFLMADVMRRTAQRLKKARERQAAETASSGFPKGVNK